jgi:hypothetical protein
MKYTKLFRVEPGSTFNLKKVDPDFTAERKKRAAKHVGGNKRGGGNKRDSSELFPRRRRMKKKNPELSRLF